MQSHSHILPLSFNGDDYSQLSYTMERFLEYAITLVQKENVSFCYIGTASEDSLIEDMFFNGFAWLKFKNLSVSKLSLTSNLPIESIEKKMRTQDIIFVGGGNTNFMLETWETSGFKDVLNQLKNEGCLPVIMGLSAGGIFPFEGAISLTADKKVYQALPTGYDWIKGSFNPHADFAHQACCEFDDNNLHNRMSAFVTAIQCGALKPGYAIPDDCMLHFCNGEFQGAFSARENVQYSYVTQEGVEKIDAVLLTSEGASDLAKDNLSKAGVEVNQDLGSVEARCSIS